jgi:hypothetical protein
MGTCCVRQNPGVDREQRGCRRELCVLLLDCWCRCRLRVPMACLRRGLKPPCSTAGSLAKEPYRMDLVCMCTQYVLVQVLSHADGAVCLHRSRLWTLKICGAGGRAARSSIRLVGSALPCRHWRTWLNSPRARLLFLRRSHHTPKLCSCHSRFVNLIAQLYKHSMLCTPLPRTANVPNPAGTQLDRLRSLLRPHTAVRHVPIRRCPVCVPSLHPAHVLCTCLRTG